MRWAATLATAALVACTSAEPATQPSPSARAEVVHEFAGGGAALEAGRIRYSVFEPPFTFAVPDGWEGGHDHPDYFDVWNGTDFVVGFARPDSIPGPRGRVDTDSLTPRRALRVLARIVEDPSPITETEIDGRPAVEMSFAVDHRTGVLRFPGGTLHLDPPWRQRAIAFDVDGTLLVILLQTTAPGDAALETPLLSSIDFESSASRR